MNIFEQYGIKEVADVTLYAIELDKNDNEVYIPVLYMDTLKVSTVEESTQQTSAQGGMGNPKLIAWDYGKDITVNIKGNIRNGLSGLCHCFHNPVHMLFRCQTGCRN